MGRQISIKICIQINLTEFFFSDPPPPFNSRAPPPSAPPPNSCHPCLPIAPIATSFMGSCANRTNQNSNSNDKRSALFFE